MAIRTSRASRERIWGGFPWLALKPKPAGVGARGIDPARDRVEAGLCDQIRSERPFGTGCVSFLIRNTPFGTTWRSCFLGGPFEKIPSNHSFQGSFSLESHQTPGGNGWFLKRTMAEKNGESTPRGWSYFFGGPFKMVAFLLVSLKSPQKGVPSFSRANMATTFESWNRLKSGWWT